MGNDTLIITNSIRKLRFFANEMTQQELADRTGVTRQTIVAIENGKYFPSLELAFRMAHTFKVPLSEVFTYNSEEDPVLKKLLNKKPKDKKK
jgi:putative transcriptional regulator